MKKIIVPVDFSPASHNAYLYARDLAQTMGATLELIHVFSGPFQRNDPFAVGEGEGRYEVLQKRLTEFAGLFPEKENGSVMTQLKLKVEAIHGEPVEVIGQRSESDEVEFILMATTGDGDAISQLLGTVSTGVAQTARCPVILVPKGIQYKAYEHILYASNFESVHSENLNQLIEFANFFKAAVHFVHIAEEGDQYEQLEESVIDQLFADADPAFSFSMSSVYNSKSVMTGLIDYGNQNNVDLIVLVNRQNDLLNNILGNSLTKRMALKSKRPLMVYHLDELN